MTINLTGVPTTLEREGLHLPLMCYRPIVPGPHAVVILAPGGIQRGAFEIMEWIGSRLCAAGFFVVTLTWRAPSPLDDPLDVRAVLDWVTSQQDIDPERIGILGMSRGGMSTLRSAALEPRLRAVATFGAVTDLIQQVRGVVVYAPGRHRVLVEWLGGEPDDRREFYETVQAISYANRIKQPVLLVHGAHDMHCPPEQSVWMKRELERYGNADVQLELVPLMGHYGDLVPNSYGFDQLANILVPFFDRKLRVRSTTPR
jgi:dipeptidyl aminopeptidase/acylaminoacyl peptidase